METEQEELGGGLVYRTHIPLAWQVVSRIDTAPAAAALNQQVAEENERCLHALALLNEYPAEMSEELQRLELKMNLVLEFMGELLARQLDLPARSAVQFAATGLSWEGLAANLPAVGQQVRVEAYLHAQYPRPLVVFGQVSGREQPGETGRCQVEFFPLPDASRDLLEKMIFTHHRREVAHRRNLGR